MMQIMQTFSDLIKALGGPKSVSAALEMPFPTVQSWVARDSIPMSAWPKVADLAKAKRLKGVTVASLTALAIEKKSRSTAPSPVSEAS
jgi:hypothetical protein